MNSYTIAYFVHPYIFLDLLYLLALSYLLSGLRRNLSILPHKTYETSDWCLLPFSVSKRSFHIIICSKHCSDFCRLVVFCCAPASTVFMSNCFIKVVGKLDESSCLQLSVWAFPLVISEWFWKATLWLSRQKKQGFQVTESLCAIGKKTNPETVCRMSF